ncbi:hypothetical protein Tco_1301394 [Tanacetum coccineum]
MNRGNQSRLTYEKLKETSKFCGAKKFFGTERAVGLLSWLEEMEYDLKKLLREEYCSGNAIKKLEEELWNHVMIGADADKYNSRFHEMARLVAAHGNSRKQAY